MDGYIYVPGPTGHAEIPADALAEALAKWTDSDDAPERTSPRDPKGATT